MMQYLKSVTSIHPETFIKMYATDKKFYFVPCVSFLLGLLVWQDIKKLRLVFIPQQSNHRNPGA